MNQIEQLKKQIQEKITEAENRNEYRRKKQDFHKVPYSQGGIDAMKETITLIESLSPKEQEEFPKGIVAVMMNEGIKNFSESRFKDDYQKFCKYHFADNVNSTIHTVQNSKGDIFSVGDETNYGTIGMFYISEGMQLYAKQDKTIAKEFGAIHIDNLTKKEERKESKQELAIPNLRLVESELKMFLSYVEKINSVWANEFKAWIPDYIRFRQTTTDKEEVSVKEILKDLVAFQELEWRIKLSVVNCPSITNSKLDSIKEKIERLKD